MPFYNYVTPTGMTKAIDEAVSKKRAKNVTGLPIATNRVVAWRDDGSIQKASCLVNTLIDIAGITTEEIANGVYGKLEKQGNIPGILAGRGIVPGSPLYLGTDGDLVLSPPVNGSIIQVGRAEPATDSTTGESEDLFIELASISEQ